MRKVIRDRQIVVADLVQAIREDRKYLDQPRLRGSVIEQKGRCNDFTIQETQSVLGAFSLGVVQRVVDRFDRVHHRFAVARNHRCGVSERIFDRVLYVYRVVWSSPIMLAEVVPGWMLLANA